MLNDVSTLDITVYPPAKQGRGAFDGGRITEYKPIGFPGDGAEVKRVGPLFYWAWASAHAPSKIGLHPHKAFEIMSYVLEGEIGHYDTLGTRSRVSQGGAQVMQTGSGVMHEEEMSEAGTQFFQIWFEPYLQEALKRPPTYAEFHHEDFPVHEEDGVTIKTVIGEGAPIQLVAEVAMVDVTVAPGALYRRRLAAGRSLAAVAIRGSGAWQADDDEAPIPVAAQDFTVIHAGADAALTVTADEGEPLRLALIEVPTEVDYPLYRK